MSSSPEMEAGSGGKKFKGVRKRKWGKWVSEIRLPNSRERIWLGSYDAPEKAARAFDAAFVCLRGPGAAGADLNFPDSPPPCRAGGCSSDPQEVQAAALSHANRAAVTAQQAAAALLDVDSPALPWEWESVAHDAAVGVLAGAGGSADEVVAPVRADGSIDWRPVMAHPPPLFSPTGWGSNAYDFLQVPPPPPDAADEDMMEDYSIHGASASLWSFDLRDSYFRY
ncbi:unnamed protein product [Urochloa decumbens]|uniref:AP2/ERF domain-containing protein n=1 Tax=Urochloa decumbens TaxID=240449 RepID=A0ABC9ECQ6_9POAL